NLAPGARVSYFVLPGDNLAIIASKLNSTVEAIVAANPDILTDGETTTIYPGWILQVPINLVTPTITPLPTVTPTP
ncbi:MAG: LysM domain-containing protein, partial [Anaerolineales bacterium]